MQALLSQLYLWAVCYPHIIDEGKWCVEGQSIDVELLDITR